MTYKTPVRLLFCCVIMFITFPLLADQGVVKIITPEEGATLPANTKSSVTYEIVLGPEGDHAHLYIDDKKIATLRSLKDEISINPLSAGEHEICIKISRKDHSLVGINKCIKVKAQ